MLRCLSTIVRHLPALLLVLLLAATPALAQNQEEPAVGVALDFKNVELAELIQTISELTGRNFIYDETVRGKATIISPRRMTMDEAYQVFLSVLNVKGYTVVPSGQVNKIVAIKDAKETSLPTVAPGRTGRRGDQYITRLVPLKHIDASEIATSVLTPLLPKTSHVVSYLPTNTLIITDSAANIARLVSIIEQLDVPTIGEGLEIIPLQYANAEEVAKIIEQFLAQKTAARPVRRTATPAAAGAAPAGVKVMAFRPTNVVVLLASPEDLETIRSLVARLDQKPSMMRSAIQVYYLENADAETLAKTLNEILTGMRTQGRTGQQRTAAAQPAQVQALDTVTITADKPTNSLIINSTPEEFEAIRDIVKQLDIKRKQVYVEALILELSMDATQKLGAALQGAISIDNDSAVFAGTNREESTASLADPSSLLTSAINGILLGGVFNPISVIGANGEEFQVPALSALIDLSRTDADINILSAPRLLTSDNEEAEIIVGQNVPIITSRLSSPTSSSDTGETLNLAQSVSVERKDVALTLRFTPQITEGNLVRLNVFQEITEIAQSSVGTVDQVGPTFTKRLVRNTVLAENGRTVVLGGLISSNVQDRVTKVPLLGDIPLLGWLFKRTSAQESKTNLLIFITPHITRNAEELAAVTRRAKEAMDKYQGQSLVEKEDRRRWAEEHITIDPSEAR